MKMIDVKDRANPKLLLVDDSFTTRALERSVLEVAGFDVVAVADGVEALSALEFEPFDIVVTDYNMPLMDGRALVSYFKQNPATANIPIIMVTTESEPRVLDPVRRLGVTAIVAKNFPAEVVGPILDSLF